MPNWAYLIALITILVVQKIHNQLIKVNLIPRNKTTPSSLLRAEIQISTKKSTRLRRLHPWNKSSLRRKKARKEKSVKTLSKRIRKVSKLIKIKIRAKTIKRTKIPQKSKSHKKRKKIKKRKLKQVKTIKNLTFNLILKKMTRTLSSLILHLCLNLRIPCNLSKILGIGLIKKLQLFLVDLRISLIKLLIMILTLILEKSSKQLSKTKRTK